MESGAQQGLKYVLRKEEKKEEEKEKETAEKKEIRMLTAKEKTLLTGLALEEFA